MIKAFRQRQVMAIALLASLFIPFSQTLAADLQGRVSWIYDGDTIRVAGIGKVRMLGIDVPEREASSRDRYFKRRGIAPVTLRRIHNRAHTFVRKHSLGQVVSLQAGQPAHDAYGRLLAYVILPDGRLLNRLLLEQGFAVVYRRFDFSLKKDFIEAEEEALRRGRGMWKNCD